MKKFLFSLTAFFFLIICLFASAALAENAAGRAAAAERGRTALLATGHTSFLQFPEEEDYLSEWKTLYARKAFYAPCLEVKSVPDMDDHRNPDMPYLYEGTEVTVVAEHDDMSCILYDGYNFKHYCGWIRSIRLLEEFPGKHLSVGSVRESGFSVLSSDLTMRREDPGYLGLMQASVSFPAVENCVGFLLEYQMIAENVDIDEYWYAVYGPRKVLVYDGKYWNEAGSFAYPEAGAVWVIVWLDQTMTVTAVGTIPDCLEPDLPLDRKTVKEFYIAE